MRLLKFLVLCMLVGGIGWLAVRTVSVESTEEKVRITIDKRKLHDVAGELEATGRQAADRVGHTLEEAGRKLNNSGDNRSRS